MERLMRIGNSQDRQAGFTYLTILFAIAVAGVVLAKTGIDWSQSSQRDRENELLFVGDQYRRAIALYYERTPGAVKHYPKKLSDLLTDTRYNPPQRYLRKLYRDPILNQDQWGIIAGPDGGIMGVHSMSEEVTIKSAGFGYQNRDIEGKTQYSSWRFIYISSSVN